MIRQVPNILTGLRVIAIPFFLWCSLSDMTLAAMFIFVIASITDYYDGFIARKYQIVSNFGKIMDPLADKLLVLSALIILNIAPILYISWIVTAVIAIREIAVTYMRHYYQQKNIIIPADIYGKIKTILQLTGIITSLVFYNAVLLFSPYFGFFGKIESGIIMGIQVYFWIVVVVTILSGVNYFLAKR